jgi:hypothetical protein
MAKKKPPTHPNLKIGPQITRASEPILDVAMCKKAEI